MIICTSCKIEKEIDNYSFRNKKKEIYFNRCKECTNIYAKNYREKNKDIIKEKQSEWYENKGRDWKKEYEKKNKDHINEMERKRYNTDIQFRMKKILRSRFKSTILEKKKYKSILSYIEVPLPYFIKWIEYQFDSNMSWDNQGSYWDIDHVQPCSSFDLTNEDNIKLCYNWKNLRPLEKRENYRKNNKIDNDIISNHKNIVELFINLYPVPS